MNEPIRILQVVNIMDRAGLETMLMNYYRHIDRTKVQFDFLTHRNKKGAYDDEIESLGGKIYRMPRLVPQNYLKYSKILGTFFQNHSEYKVVHSHIDAMSSFPLKAAKKANVKIRIAHSHSSKLDRDFKLPIKYISKNRISKYANKNFACGEKAGKFLFKDEPFVVIKNAIDLDIFEYNVDIRKRVRKDLNIPNDVLVIGHVGRFTYVKNQSFLIDVLANILKRGVDAYLLLIGSGKEEKTLRSKVKNYGLEEKVKFLIDRSDVNELYQAMDCFVMPSLFEGLPVVGVEAQANGLPCIFSSNISKEILITSNATMIELGKGVEEWSNMILSINKGRNIKAKEELQKCNYDIKSEATKLMKMYITFNQGDVE